MRLKLKPKDPNAIIRDPRTKRPLEANGSWVSDSSFWRRRIVGKEVEVIETREIEPTKAAEADEPDAPETLPPTPTTTTPTGLEPTTPLTTRGRLPLRGDDR